MQKIIEQVQNHWTKDLIIRFLYIKLAPYFQRDLSYFLADDEEKERQYKQGFVNHFPHIVCSTLADFYVDLFKQYGINAKKIVANSAKIPLFTIIVEGDYGLYFLDPLNDLLRNQYGLRTHYFGTIPRYNTICNAHPKLVGLPDEYIAELDNTLNITYLNEYFSNLRKILTIQKSANEFFGLQPNSLKDLKSLKLQFCNDKLINLGNVNGPYERAQLYMYLYNKIFNNTEKKQMDVIIIGGAENPHICVEMQESDKSIFFEEKKRDGKYVLARKFEIKNNEK